MVGPIHIEDFVKRLRGLEDAYITRDRVAEFCAEHRVDTGSLAPHIRFREDRYTRNLVFRDAIFEVMVLCWRPGMKTPIHSHNGQLGWMMVQTGSIDVINYKYISCNAPSNQNVSGLDCLAGATRINLNQLGRKTIDEGAAPALVDKVQTIHQLTVGADNGDNTVTLHLYSLPFESCVTYDQDSGRCGRRTLQWDSEYGNPINAPVPAG